MSEEKSEETQSVDESIECSMCGRLGGPIADCQLCNGNTRFTRPRQYTLSEERQGKNPNAKERYGESGQIGPERIQGGVVLPKGN